MTCFVTWKSHVFSEDSSSCWNMNSGLLRRGTMNQLVYGSSNSFGRMSIMPLEETNWEGGEGIIDHNNPITLHNNTRRSTDWFKCLSRWYADEFWCLSVRPLDNWLRTELNTVADYYIQLKPVYTIPANRSCEGLWVRG